MRILLSSLAKQQLREGYHFYEQQSAGLGGYFLDSLMADIDSLHIHAGVHAVAFDNYHRLLARRFPYSIYYRMARPVVSVHAIFDNRRNPEWILKQLAGSREP